MTERKFITDSEIEIKEIYTGENSNEMPGEFPYTRGVQKDMYRGRLWTMRQYAGFSTAEESNKRYKYLLANGTMGLIRGMRGKTDGHVYLGQGIDHVSEIESCKQIIQRLASCL